MIAGRWVMVLAAACLLLAAPGCKVDQAKEVATYRAVLDAETPPPAPFHRGQPLSLEEAMLLANLHNERLGLRGEEYLLALIAKERAAATFLPTLSLAPTYSAQDSSRELAGRTDDPNNRRTDVPLVARANVFNGFSDLAAFRAARDNIRQRRALLLDAQAQVLVDVARVYYQVLRAQSSVDVLSKSLVVQEERLRDIRTRREVGWAVQLDVAQVAAQAAATRVSLIAARNDVANGREVLALLTGAPVQESVLADDLRLPQRLPPIEELQELALRHRQDLAAAVAATEAAREFVTAAIGRYYPSVSVNLSYFLSRESPPTDVEWTSLISANLPIFSAGLIHADVRQAWSFHRQSQLVESSTRRQIIQEVQISLDNLVSSMARLEELQVQVSAAEEARRLAEQSYRAGLRTNLEWLAAQDRLLSAELGLTSEQFNQKVFYLNLLRAIGRLSTHLPGENNLPANAPATLPAVAQ